MQYENCEAIDRACADDDVRVPTNQPGELEVVAGQVMTSSTVVAASGSLAR